MSSERGWSAALVAGVAVFLAARLAVAVEAASGTAIPFSIVAAVALWSAWRWGARGAACAAVAVLASSLWTETASNAAGLTAGGVVRALGIAVALASQAYAGKWSLERSATSRPLLSRAPEVARFVVSQAAACALGAAIAWTAFQFAPEIPAAVEGTPGLAWFLRELLGVLAFAPALLVFSDDTRRRFQPSQRIEAALLAAAVAGAGALASVGVLGAESSFQHVQALIVPCLLWAALRLGLTGTVAVFPVATAAAWWSLPAPVTESGALALQCFVGIAGLTALVLAAALEERRAALETLREARDELERRVQLRTSDLETSNRALHAESVERAHVQSALRESEARLHATLEHLPFEIWLCNREGRCVVQNRKSIERWGLVTGKRIEDFAPDAPTRARLLDHHRRALAGEVVADAYEQLVGATTRSFDTIAAPVREDGNVTGVVGASLEATERRELYSRLQQSQRMESVGRLAGGVAHDFNNVLTAILGYAEIAQLKLSPQHEVASDVREIQRAAQRAADLTRQLLVFSRKHAPRPRLVVVDELVAGVEKLLRRVIGETIELSVDVRCGPASVKVDPGQFEQMLVNLAVRARDAMKSGGTLAIETRSDCDGGPGLPQGRFVVVEVSDTGTPLENVERAFEPFFASAEKSDASGLELAMVYAIARQAGGDVRVTSEASRGTRFAIVLPQAVATEEPAPALPKERSHEGSETLLLVEDEPLVRRITAADLRARGYTVLEAADGEEALRVAGTHAARIDCVLTDLVMPRLGGEELVHRLRPQRPGIRVLFVSGYSNASPAFDPGSNPDAAFLSKPFGPAQLSRALRELLDRAARA